MDICINEADRLRFEQKINDWRRELEVCRRAVLRLESRLYGAEWALAALDMGEFSKLAADAQVFDDDA